MRQVRQPVHGGRLVKPEKYCYREPWCLKTPGHPGGCPETREEQRERINRRARRNHVFVGDGPYCEAMISAGTVGDPATTGTITFSSGCGYPRQHHPDENGYAPGD